ncbi:MAG: hypothetical protein ACYSUU_00215, partial [Planctomycetota bacterium]
MATPPVSFASRSTLDEGGVGLGDDDLPGGAEFGELDVLEAAAEVLAEEGASGQGRDVAEHRLATVAEAGSLHRTDLEHAAQSVHDEGREGLVVDVLGDDEERLARTGDLVEERQQVREVRDLLLVDQDHRLLDDRLGPLGVVHEIGTQVALVDRFRDQGAD